MDKAGAPLGIKFTRLIISLWVQTQTQPSQSSLTDGQQGVLQLQGKVCQRNFLRDRHNGDGGQVGHCGALHLHIWGGPRQQALGNRNFSDIHVIKAALSKSLHL